MTASGESGESGASGEWGESRAWARDGALRRWAAAWVETAGIVAAFLAVGLGYGAWLSRAPAEPARYVAERAPTPEEPPAHVAAWSGGGARSDAGAARP